MKINGVEMKTKAENASNLLREQYPLQKLEELFESSIKHHSLMLKDLHEMINRKRGTSYTARMIQYFRYWIRGHRLEQNPRFYPNFLSILTDMAEVPFFWDKAQNAYIPTKNILSLLNTGFLYSTELEVYQRNFDSVVKDVLLLSVRERLLVAKIALNSVNDFHLSLIQSPKISLSSLASLRLPTLLSQSLEALGYGHDYLEAANNVKSLGNNDERIAVFAAYLQEIIENRTTTISFDDTSIAGFAELACEVIEWKDTAVVINPQKTYLGRVDEFIQALNSNERDLYSL